MCKYICIRGVRVLGEGKSVECKFVRERRRGVREFARIGLEERTGVGARSKEVPYGSDRCAHGD